MTARPILLIGKRRYSFHWTTLVAPANDWALRCIAFCAAANDDGWQGRAS